MNAPLPKIKPGLHKGMPMEQYLADPCPSPSLSSHIAIKLLSHSPKHAWCEHPRLNSNYVERNRTDFDIGTCAHAILLEGDESKLEVIDPRDYVGPRGGIPKGWTTDAIKTARDNARAAGKVPLLTAQAEAVRQMVAVCREYIVGSEIEEVMKDGDSELTGIWKEGKTWFKIRPDFLSKDRSVLVHYKTTARCAEPESFGRFQFTGMGYDIAAAFYERGLRELEGEERDVHTVFLVQESEPPYECSLLGLDPELAALATRKVDLAVELWNRCMQTGKWPAYPKRVAYLGAKPWQTEEFEVKRFQPAGFEIDPEQSEHGMQA